MIALAPAMVAAPVRASANVHFSFAVQASGDDAFELVTPEGEGRWDPSWHPRYLTASHSAAGSVFETGRDSGLHVWLVDSVDRESRRIRYVVVRPGAAALTFDIDVKVLAPRTARVSVRYYAVALTAAQDAAIRDLGIHADDMAREWQRAFERALATK